MYGNCFEVECTQKVQQHRPCMAVADVVSSLICIRQITPLDAIATSWVDVMKDSNRMPGDFALPADPERAMALDHIHRQLASMV
jgi:hypothetical protein